VDFPKRSLAVPNKRAFDLTLSVAVATLVAAGGARIWATRYMSEGKPSGFLYSVAAITKGVLG
jgi:hypothetical protein